MLAAMIALWPAASALAGAVTDGSVGAVQSLSGAFTVPQSLGQVRGANLFHSFASFSIAAGESAIFQAGAGIGNVISRVTGGQPSMLQGPLALQAAGGGAPHFFFVNPSGITVGAGATFDVPAGLHLSTAPQLRFADGTVWATGSTAASTLTLAAPESFGFLGAGSAGALRWAGGGAQLAQGSTLELAGGSIAVEGAVLLAPGGHIRLSSPGAVDISAGALVGAAAGVAGGVGRVSIDAATLSVTGTDTLPTGVVAQTGPAAQGGGITITLSGALTVSHAAEIIHQGLSATDNGSTVIRAASALLDAEGFYGSIASNGLGTAAGPALQLDITGRLALAGGDITSYANGAGRGGAVRVNAGSLHLDGQGFNGFGSISSYSQPGGGAPGALAITSQGALELVRQGSIGSNNRSADAAGAVQVDARSLLLDGAGSFTAVIALGSGAGRSAAVSVNVTERATLRLGGQVSSSTLGSGAGGDVALTAGEVTMEGVGAGGASSSVTGVYGTSLLPNAGPGGTVRVTADRITMTGDAGISTSTRDSAAGAGDVRVQAHELSVDGQQRAGGIQSVVYAGPGNAGLVQVDVRDSLTLLNGGSITAGTQGAGTPGSIVVNAGTLRVDGRNAGGTYTGIGGDALGAGAGAPVLVQARRVELDPGGSISSATASARDAGDVTVRADSVRVDGGARTDLPTGISATSSGAGNAGTVWVEAAAVEVINGGSISTSAVGSGRGGPVRVLADTLRLARGGNVNSVSAGQGDAGLVNLQVRGAMLLDEGGIVAASSGGAGAAGRVSVQAGTLTLQGADPTSGQRSRIASRALPTSGGDAGAIDLTVTGEFSMSGGALLSIANDAPLVGPAVPLTPSFVRVQAGRIVMQGGEVTAASSQNADAGAIVLRSGGDIRLGNSTLRTTAFEGNGGPITLTAGLSTPGVVTLRNTSVTTSVDGTAGGNGGNIRIGGQALVLASGFVQGNTLAALASGGDVTIDTPLLVPDGDNVFIGGTRIALFRPNQPGFNVIQAAAPNGLAGTLDVTRPELSLAGTLAALATARIDFGALGRDMCRLDESSSFTPLGRGALPAGSAEPLGVRR
ncbi:MAG: filamentous hemagglutinin N-terminal domain-containing protein [Rubrivivax sp.]|nr:filamentous hemagglutinin N-terminal domain-containing protein [Rubrivivax sp.]